ncbi:stage II sporulation protein E [Bacillus ectoiniformans]|uniref:stage II sporulation protein E n=1 Tax=Bacillus ectoiniformans TaxID=1494429 RepID=UPI00195AF681|nr:stage II sporulation protein E [Bacillus ectoiniformans]MBM7650290.1 stage II sporulation protein E [Bacillus ectoiniformans]
MERVERNMIEPVSHVDLEGTKMEVFKGVKQFSYHAQVWLIEKGFLLLLIGFLLGRALILSHLTPFALPFFAAVFMLKRDHAPLALVGLLAGALTLSLDQITYSFVTIFIFLISYRLLKNFHKEDVVSLPFYVFFTVLAVKSGFAYFQGSGVLAAYDLLMGVVEASLAFVLTLIFMQSIPFLSLNKRIKSLKNEEIISLVIMLASITSGTIGWTVYGLSMEHIFSRYLVLIFAFISGAAVGSTVGVVTGLIFSLANVASFYQMSLLAFSGLLGGLLKEWKRAGAAAGLLVATLLAGMYGESGVPLTLTLYESIAAIILLFLTPKLLTDKLAKLIPGTVEHSSEQQQYLRKIRDVTASRVEQFSEVFDALSNSFSQYNVDILEDYEERELDMFLSHVTEKTCQTCFKKEQCWANNFNQTYHLMKDVLYELDDGKGELSPKLKKDLDKHCYRPKKVEEAITQQLTYYQANQKLKKQVYDSRKLVAEQLRGVSEVMSDFADEIQRERENHHNQEEQIFEAIESYGMEIEQIDIYNLQKGSIDIDMTIPYSNTRHGECQKLIAPMLSDILLDNVIVHKEECSGGPAGVCQVTFRSAKAFVVETGAAHAAKGGGLVSGDSYSTIELGAGKYAVAISDGMGNGERAHYESHETLSLLQQILKSGIEEKVAIKSVNSILSLRTTDEIFSTLDLVIIDLQDAAANFLKVGSTPSFIKRGNKIIKVEASNLPIGILQEFEVDVVTEQLKSGDLIIMMSDGVFEGPRNIENTDLWMKRKISELETEDPQMVADLLMEEVIRTRSGEIEDDMTVVVAKVEHNLPKWASIPMNLSLSKKKKKIS